MENNEIWSERIRLLPPYLFAEIDQVKTQLRKEGKNVIDLSIGDPDLPTPSLIVDRLSKEVKNSKHHQYPSYKGSQRFRLAVSAWFQERFGVPLDEEKEVLALIGSKEGIAHAPLAFLNPGDVGLVPDPGYPVYATAISFAGGIPFFLPLREENFYRPQFHKIPSDILQKTKFLFLNYPNNPTSAVVDVSWMEEVVHFAKKHQILIFHDAAYSEVFFDGLKPPSFLQIKGFKEIGLEFHSLSKTFNMTGWRIGFVVGNEKAVSGLGKIKTNIDSGVFTAIQEAGISGLENWKEICPPNRLVFEKRRNLVSQKLKEKRISFLKPKATFYFWCRVPTKESSVEFCRRILLEKGVCFTPGVGFGKEGEGYFRISTTCSEALLLEGLSKMGSGTFF